MMELEELMIYMDGMVSHQDRECIQAIQKCLGENKMWSNFVDKIWKEEQLLMHQCTAAVCTSDKNTILVSPINDIHATPWHVKMPEHDADTPSCNCPKFSNTKIPCRHIGAAFWYLSTNENICKNLLRRLIFEERNLLPRWLVRHHPMYNHAIGIFETDMHEPKTVMTTKEHTPHLYMTSAEFGKIGVPSRSSVRYAKINELFGRLTRLSSGSDFFYKIVYGNALKFESALTNYLQEVKSAPTLPPSFQSTFSPSAEAIANTTMVLKPAAVNDARTDTTNLAKRHVNLPIQKQNQKKKKCNPVCQGCFFYTGSEVIGHKSYSNKCPHRHAPDHRLHQEAAILQRASNIFLSQKALSQSQTALLQSGDLQGNG
jgi:hypothetical protein